jgi:hypothetical protein
MKKIVFILLSAVMCLTANAQFFEKVNYIGALETSSSKDWTKGWTQWDPKKVTYDNISDSTTLTSSTGEVNITGTVTLTHQRFICYVAWLLLETVVN